MNFNLLMSLVLIALWSAAVAYIVGRQKGYEVGSESTKAIYAPSYEKNVQSIKQLREAAVSYGYADWVVTDNKNGETDFRWKTKSIPVEK
jgi:hypothetical protein